MRSVEDRPPASELLDLLAEVATAVRAALGATDDWGLTGGIAGQHHSDLAADEAALAVLERAGVGVLSEESGRHRPDADLTVVVDPLDGSTNAAHGIPWYATSLCAVDGDGPVAALVVNLASGTAWSAQRGAGAWCWPDGLAGAAAPAIPSGVTDLANSIVGLSGLPARWLGWRQYRALGAAALDLCLVAGGALDAYLDCSRDAHGPWDYLGGLLVCREAGAHIVDAQDRDLVVLDHDARRTPVAGATAALVEEAKGRLLAARTPVQ